MTVWKEPLYYFRLAPPPFREILFVLKNHHIKRGIALGRPEDVEIWEWDDKSSMAERINV
jgi:hypothetical protein